MISIGHRLHIPIGAGSATGGIPSISNHRRGIGHSTPSSNSTLWLRLISEMGAYGEIPPSPVLLHGAADQMSVVVSLRSWHQSGTVAVRVVLALLPSLTTVGFERDSQRPAAFHSLCPSC